MTEKAYFAAGCFWGVEASFRNIPGVAMAVSGYGGGLLENPTYEQVCTGKTGHAEVVEVTFHPDKVTFSELVDYFWQLHDPCQLNRQGVDVGTQYRSAIFYVNEGQKSAALASKNAWQDSHHKKVATEISAFVNFFAAEDYHQNYFAKNPHKAACAVFHP